MNWLEEGNPAQLQARLSELLRYVQAGKCANAVTHDVNNYLGAILAYAELIGMDPGLNDESKRMLGEIGRAVQGCTTLVETMTIIARPKSKGAVLCDVGSLAKRVLDVCLYDLRVARIKSDFRADEGIASIPGDEGALGRGLLYLFSNAIERLDEESVKEIKIRVLGHPEGVTITVQNSGGPIPASDRDEIFDPGYTTKNGGHLGFGLSEARKVAAQHKGDLSYDPERGFVLDLPRDNGLEI